MKDMEKPSGLLLGIPLKTRQKKVHRPQFDMWLYTEEIIWQATTTAFDDLMDRVDYNRQKLLKCCRHEPP